MLKIALQLVDHSLFPFKTKELEMSVHSQNQGFQSDSDTQVRYKIMCTQIHYTSIEKIIIIYQAVAPVQVSVLPKDMLQIMQELRKHMVEMLRRQGTINVILMESITFLIWDSFIGQLDVNSSLARHTMAQTGARPKTTSASKHYLQAPVSVCSGTSSPGSTRIRKISGSMVLPPSLSESNISCADLSDRLSCSL